MDDRALLELLKASPEEGMRRLMDMHMGLVCTVVRGRLSGVCDSRDIEECAADVFADFYGALGRFDIQKGTVKAYLCAIARRRSADIYTRRLSEGAHISLDAEGSAESFASDFSLDDSIIGKDTQRALLEAVRALESPDREIIIGKFLLRESSRSLAARLSMTVSAVDTRAHRALRKLRERLGDIL